jgi:2-C-methyl-D-erythritol 4-phosphate cytidylyltransferase
VAAGLGVRLGGGTPKALRLLAGEPLLVHALRRVRAAREVGALVVAAPPGEVGPVRELAGPDVIVVPGGATRQASVAAALAAVPAHCPIVLVHDAARALAPTALIEAVAAAVRAGADAVIPVLPVVDTIKEVAGGTVVGTVDRSVLRAALDSHTDDAGLVEKMGVPVATVPGHEAALKITRPVDLVIAEALLAGTLDG